MLHRQDKANLPSLFIAMSSAGTIAYNSFASTSNAITLENVITVTPTDDGVQVLYQLNLDATAQPQVNVLTIGSTLPTADAYYKVTIDDYTTNAAQTFTYFYSQASTDTAQTIAASLAALINAATPNHPQVAATVQASPNDNKINVASLLPGTNGAFTLTVACKSASDNSDVSGSPIASTSTAGTGTGKIRSIVQYLVEVQPSENATSQYPAYPELRLSGTWYNGASTPTAQSTISPLKVSGPMSLDALLAVT